MVMAPLQSLSSLNPFGQGTIPIGMWITLGILTQIKSLLKKLDNVKKEPPSSDFDAREESIQAALQK
jgi:hypothetical protein